MQQKSIIDEIGEAIHGQPGPRAVHEIQAEVFAICRRLEGASEAQEWRSLYNLAERLRDLSERGMYHASQAKVKEIGQEALGKHQEPEPR